MSLSDCEQCWETPCICGHDYKGMSTEYVIKLRDVLNRELERRGPAAAQVPDRSALPLPLQIMACACRSYGTNANGGSRNDCAGVRLVGNELVACKCICHPENR